MDDATFSKLVAQAVQGDRFELGQLLMEHFDLIADRVAKSLPKSLAATHSIDDLVQQTFAAVITAIGNYEHRSRQTFVAWLQTIAERQVRNAIRHARRQKRGGKLCVSSETTPLGPSSRLRLANLVPAKSESPSKRVAAREAIRAVQSAVSHLPATQRDAVVQHHLQEKSIESTAVLLDRSPGAIRGLLHRARQSLRESMGKSSRWFEKKP